MLISNAVFKPPKPLASYYSHLSVAPFHNAPDCSFWSLLSLSLPLSVPIIPSGGSLMPCLEQPRETCPTVAREPCL